MHNIPIVRFVSEGSVFRDKIASKSLPRAVNLILKVLCHVTIKGVTRLQYCAPVNFIIDMILGEEVHLQQPEIAIKIVGKEERERLYCYYTEEDEDTANCNGYSADKC